MQPLSLNLRLRVALLDDHAAILHGLAAQLTQERDLDVVGSFSGSREMITCLQRPLADFFWSTTRSATMTSTARI